MAGCEHWQVCPQLQQPRWEGRAMPREHLAPNPCIEPGAKGKIPFSRFFYSTVIQVTTLGVHWGEGGEVAPGGRGGKKCLKCW